MNYYYVIKTPLPRPVAYGGRAPFRGGLTRGNVVGEGRGAVKLLKLITTLIIIITVFDEEPAVFECTT